MARRKDAARVGLEILVTGGAALGLGVLVLAGGFARSDTIWRAGLLLIPAGVVLTVGGRDLRRYALRGWWLAILGMIALVPAFALIRENLWGAVVPLAGLVYLVWVKDDLRLGAPRPRVEPRRRAHKRGGAKGKRAGARGKR